MELSAYLDRIGYRGRPQPNLATLRALHRAHLLAIPYENLDVMLGRPVSIAPPAAYAKLVEGRRGGWCYEMNGLFGWALEAIGFAVTRRSAHGSARDSHLLLQVDLGGEPIIADVGFSDGPIEPYAPAPGAFSQRGFGFTIEATDDGFRLNNHPFGLAKGFVAGPPNETAMAERCEWLQTAPESPFTQHAIVCRHTDSGVLTLVDRTLRIVTPQGAERRMVADADEYLELLSTRFGLDLPEAAALWPGNCARHEAFLAERAKAKQAGATAG